jgi:DNA-binding transcriptional ArsR family regulator
MSSAAARPRRSRDAHLDAVFSALAHPARRRILARLARGPATVGQLAKPFAMSLPAVSRHLRVLEDAGLLSRRRDWRNFVIALEPGPLAAANRHLERYRPFWDDTLDALAAYLEEKA